MELGDKESTVKCASSHRFPLTGWGRSKITWAQKIWVQDYWATDWGDLPAKVFTADWISKITENIVAMFFFLFLMGYSFCYCYFCLVLCFRCRLTARAAIRYFRAPHSFGWGVSSCLPTNTPQAHPLAIPPSPPTGHSTRSALWPSHQVYSLAIPPGPLVCPLLF